MKLISYILILLLSTCWLLSTQEELICADGAASCHSVISNPSKASNLAKTHEHVNELGSCHFGHCAHIMPKLNVLKLEQFAVPIAISFDPCLTPKTLDSPFISYRPPAFS